VGRLRELVRPVGRGVARLLFGIAGAVAIPLAALGGEVEHVIHISVDGVNAGMLQSLIENDTNGDFDNFKRFLDEGATTYNARTDYTHTWTLPNHTSMLTARPVGGDPGTGSCTSSDHCYTDNGLPLPTTTLHSNHPGVAYMSGTVDVAHDHGLSTGFYASKTKFVLYSQTWEGAGGPDPIPPDHGTDKIDTYKNQISRVFDGLLDDAYDLTQSFVSDMGTSHFNYAFLHLVDPDKSGHLYGWGTSQYGDALRQIDGYLGNILALVEGDPVLDGRTVVIVTSDHGGTGTGHGDQTDSNNYTIPFFVWGAGVDAGADLYALNSASRSDPGGGRPDYDAPGQPIRNGGSGNLALSLLGLPPIPAGSGINTAQDLIVGTWSVQQIPVPASSLAGKLALLALVLAAGVACLARRPGAAA
jgi:hypothetical protein